jgi:hypothetical protein
LDRETHDDVPFRQGNVMSFQESFQEFLMAMAKAKKNTEEKCKASDESMQPETPLQYVGMDMDTEMADHAQIARPQQ